MMMEFMNSQAKNLGPYWPQPGRSILENLLKDVPFPFQLQQGGEDSAWEEDSATRIAHKLASEGIPDLAWTRGAGEEETFRMEVGDGARQTALRFAELAWNLLQQVMTFDQLNGYFHTSSASLRYFKAVPSLGMEKPDLIDRHADLLRAKVLQERADGVGCEEGLDDDHIRVAWPLGLMMVRKR